MEKKYWIKIENSEAGPFSFEELLKYNVDADSPFWHIGLDNWIVFKESELFNKYVEKKEHLRLGN